MSPRTRTVLLAVLLATLPAAALGQVTSHCLPESRPAGMLPSRLLDTPPVHAREVSLPLVHEQKNEAPSEASDAEIRRLLGLKTETVGRPDATSLSAMVPEARRVVEQARSGAHRAAAEAGDRLLRSASGRFGDYTWDYVGSATAWSHLQLGQAGAAATAHGLAAGHIRDPDVTTYHRMAAAAIREAAESPGGAARLKDPAAWNEALREQLVDTLKTFRERVELAGSVRSATRRLDNLRQAYKQMRILEAADPDLAREKAVPAFREAADTLCTESIPEILDGGRKMHDRLAQLRKTPIKGVDWGLWCRLVSRLWDTVREAKRVCRAHDYLRRLGLASSRESGRLFREANGLLFAPGSRRKIWNPRGGLRGAYSRDIRKLIPYDETLIRPM
ncbi:MAG: hypothetical protein R6X20_13530 [Phycisphaerae bacterium]